MMKKKYHFKITVESLDPVEEGRTPKPPLAFNVSNHDNILAIVKRLCAGTHFDENSATAFSVGLKLMTEVMLEYRDDPLFSEFKPAVVQFMKRLKSQINDPVEQNTDSASVLVAPNGMHNSQMEQKTLSQDRSLPAENVPQIKDDKSDQPLADHLQPGEEITLLNDDVQKVAIRQENASTALADSAYCVDGLELAEEWEPEKAK